MSNKLVVLNNVLNVKFIVTMEKAKFHSEETNPRVSPEIEKSILIEYKNANFKKNRLEEDSEEGIIWVETKGENVLAQ